MLVVIYATPGIAWQREFAPKMERGLRAIGVNVEICQEPVHREGLPILLGTSRWRSLEHGPFLLVDRCSFGDTNHWVSLVRDGHGRRGDHRVPEHYSASRWESIEDDCGIQLQPWHNGPKTVLCGQTDSWSPHWPELRDWYAPIVATHFRPHPAGDNPTGLPETRKWDGVGKAITLNSSVAVEAVLAGVPTVTMDEGSMAWDVTSHVSIETLKPPRLPWLHWLAWTQWTHDEIEEGRPWAHLL